MAVGGIGVGVEVAADVAHLHQPGELAFERGLDLARVLPQLGGDPRKPDRRVHLLLGLACHAPSRRVAEDPVLGDLEPLLHRHLADPDIVLLGASEVREMAVKKGLKISEYGVFSDATGRRVAGKTEEEVYAAIGLPWIPPELREDTGEVEAALKGKLPRLVEVGDIRGDLHAHTDASDGHHSIEALVEAARVRGYQYIVVSDHSRSSTVARGLSADELRAHVDKIREVQKGHRDIRILAGSECDILPDGSMDYPDALLALLDIVIGAVHSRFKQPKVEMTRRICAALANPYVNILAHPTGRLIGEREPYDVDLEQVFQVARRHGKAIEINSYPERLDLNDAHARRAAELGVLVAINTDTHLLAHLDNIDLGVATARSAWIEPAQVINAWPLEKLLDWARKPRSLREGKAQAR